MFPLFSTRHWRHGAAGLRARSGNHMKGDRHPATPNEPPAFAVHYYLPDEVEDGVVVTAHDTAGEERARLDGGGAR